MRISLRAVASQLGMSHSTVSRALRQDPRISLETRKRVKDTCKKLGYRPNAMLSELSSFRWKADKVSKGSVIAYIDRARVGTRIGYLGLAACLKTEADILGYDVAAFRADDFDSSAKLQRTLRNRGITDIILGPVFEPSFTVELDWDKFICVQLLPGFSPLPFHSVMRDHYNSVIVAWQNVVNKGYQRVGIVLFDHQPVRLGDDMVRLSAVHACQNYLFPHLPVIPPLLYHEPWSSDFAQWVKTHRPDAIIDFNQTHYQFYKTEFGHPIPYASLHCSRDGFSGVIDSMETCATEAVKLLHFCRRTYQWGLPPQRIDHVIEPVWHEGTTLPKKAA